jgi:hypothetical protein
MTNAPEDDQDLFGFVAPTESELSSISLWASKALELRAEIEQIEAHLKHLNKELAIIEEIDLPRVMMAAGVPEFTTNDGSKISIDDVIQGGLTKEPDKREFTFQWFIDNGGKENIKDHFEMDFTKGEYGRALELRKLLQENNVNFSEAESIHASTMKSFLNEKIREGTMPPFDKMGLRYFKRAKIKKD